MPHTWRTVFLRYLKSNTFNYCLITRKEMICLKTVQRRVTNLLRSLGWQGKLRVTLYNNFPNTSFLFLYYFCSSAFYLLFPLPFCTDSTPAPNCFAQCRAGLLFKLPPKWLELHLELMLTMACLLFCQDIPQRDLLSQESSGLKAALGLSSQAAGLKMLRKLIGVFFFNHHHRIAKSPTWGKPVYAPANKGRFICRLQGVAIYS